MLAKIISYFLFCICSVEPKPIYSASILFNAKVNNVDGCGSFFQAGGTPQQALDYILTPYNLDNFKNKAGSVIVGEDLYGYRELKNLIV